MRQQILHIFRNNPAGRESLLASKLMSQQLNLPLLIWIPAHQRFDLEYGVHEIMVTLDETYFRSPDTAVANIDSILAGECTYCLFEPTTFKDTHMPYLPVDCRMMTCPRLISDHSERVGLGHVGPGHIGPAVRTIVKHSIHPVLIPGQMFVPWQSLAVMCGSSPLGVRSVRVGLDMAQKSKVPLSIFTFAESDKAVKAVESALAEAGLLDEMRERARWVIWRGGTFQDHLLEIPRDALLLVGAAGHGAMHELFGKSKLSRVQHEWPGARLVIGPHCNA